MKLIVKISASLILLFSFFGACKKERDDTKHQPVARAGNDQFFPLTKCSDTVIAELDGTASSDPDNNIVSYRWRNLIDTPVTVLNNPNSAKTMVTISRGSYLFELMIKDKEGHASRDTVAINLIPKEYDLDITYYGRIHFFDNSSQCDPYYATSCDQTIIGGVVQFPPISQFRFSINEFADPNPSVFKYYTIFRLRNNNDFISGSQGGNSGFSFKALIQLGGTSFSSTIKLTNGSARACNPSAFANNFLSVTGSLNANRDSISLRITGKVIF